MRLCSKFMVLFISLSWLLSCKPAELSQHNEPDWWGAKKFTTARVVEYSVFPDFYFVYQFNVDGKLFYCNYNESRPDVIVDLGSRFSLAYNPNFPEKNELL